MDLSVSKYSEYAKKAMEILPTGAFLTTANKEKTNVMTIGWGTFGFQWRMPTVEIMVRDSRFSKTFIDDTKEFTLSFPLDKSVSKALGYCGQKSGRDCDKLKDCGLITIPAKEISVPVIVCKSIVFECKVVAETKMNTDAVSSEILDKWYNNGDLHTMYYAKVLDCYEID